MQEYRLKRTRHDDLVFTGECIAASHDREDGENHASWIEMKLFRTAVGKYILAAALHFSPKGTTDLHETLSFASAHDAIRFLMEKRKGLETPVNELLSSAAGKDQAFYVALRRTIEPQPSILEIFEGKMRRLRLTKERLRRENFRKLHARRTY